MLDRTNKIILAKLENNRILITELDTKVFISSYLGLIPPHKSKFFYYSIDSVDEKNFNMMQIIEKNEKNFDNFEKKIRGILNKNNNHIGDNLTNCLEFENTDGSEGL